MPESDETEYWENIRYRTVYPLAEMRFPDASCELNFRKLLGWSLFCDPLHTHRIIDLQMDFLCGCFESVLSRRTTAPPMRVLDVGCGTGYKIESLSARYGLTGFGCDLSSDVISFADKQGTEVNYFVHDIRQPLQIREVDVVVCCTVLQHLKQKEQALGQIHDCLRVGGSLIVIDACYENLFGKLATRGLQRIRKQKYLRMLEDSGFHVLRESAILRDPCFGLLDGLFVNQTHYDPAATCRSDYRPRGLYCKIVRALARLSNTRDRKRDIDRLRRQRRPRLVDFTAPMTEMGVLCERR